MSGSGLGCARAPQLVDGERRLAAPRLRRPPAGADDVAEVDVDVAGASRVAHELDAPGAVDEVEEDELPHLAPRHDAAREPLVPSSLGAGLELLGRGANVGDRDAIGKALRRHQGETLSGCGRPKPASQVGPEDVSAGITQRTQRRLRVRRAVII